MRAESWNFRGGSGGGLDPCTFFWGKSEYASIRAAEPAKINGYGTLRN